MQNNRSLFQLLTSLFLLGLLVACAKETSPAADTVFLNARIYTVNEEQAWAEALAIRDGRIVYVGDTAGAMALVDGETTQFDLDGKLLLPGFIDTHVHPLHGGGYARALSLDTSSDIDAWVEAIDEFARSRPEAEIIFGYGFLASTFGPQGPTRQLIDAVVPDRPVLIMDEGFHGAWANSAALERLNISQDTADPVPGYSYYKRDENGDATGYLLEGTAGQAVDQLDIINDDEVTEGTKLVIDIMNSYGVTGAFDAGGGGGPERSVDILENIARSGELTIRLVGAVFASTEDSPAESVAIAARWRDVVKGDLYRYDTLKIPDDGTVEGRTAAMFEEYQGEPGNSGETVFSEEQLVEMISGAAVLDIDVHIHALGERAVHETLNAIEATRARVPDSKSRYTICHLQVVIDQDIPRFAELDVIAQSTPLWASYDEYGEQFVSEDQFNRYWRYKSLEDAGAKLTFGSDFPASGAGTLGLSPIMQIEIGRTRQYPGEPDSPIQPRESERLSVESLVRGFTIDAAYQIRMEDKIGSIEVGKLADIVVLDQNIFDVDPYTIHKTNVVMTVLNGEVIYSQ